MSTTKDGGPAFPHSLDWGWSDKLKRYEAIGFHGMTLRDWFAGQALAGLLSKLPVVDQSGEFGVPVSDKLAYNRDVAVSAYAFADAMLAAREGGAE